MKKGQTQQNSDKLDFKSRSGLNYGGGGAVLTSKIQESFHQKYFKDTPSSLKSLAKDNQFLTKKSSGIRPSDVVKNPSSSIKKSSLCQNPKPAAKIHYGTNPYDFAKHTNDRNFEEA